LGGRGRQISEFEASLVYKVSSRRARAIMRNPVSKEKKKKITEIKLDTCYISWLEVSPYFILFLFNIFYSDISFPCIPSKPLLLTSPLLQY
jgi:hypothetical protein